MRTDGEHVPHPTPWPQAVWNQLDGVDFRLLEQINYLARTAADRRQSGALYCTPGRKWLATRLGVSICTISRHVSKLARLQVLHRIQRRPIAGRWQTNLYRPIHWTCWKVSAVRARLLTATHRVAQAIHLAPSKRGISGAKRQTEGAAYGRDQWRGPT